MSENPTNLTQPTFSEIQYETDGPSATITLNRPAQMNAWTDHMGDGLRAACKLAEADESITGIILTGAERAFCAGADLSILDNIQDQGEMAEPGESMPGDDSFPGG